MARSQEVELVYNVDGVYGEFDDRLGVVDSEIRDLSWRCLQRSELMAARRLSAAASPRHSDTQQQQQQQPYQQGHRDHYGHDQDHNHGGTSSWASSRGDFFPHGLTTGPLDASSSFASRARARARAGSGRRTVWGGNDADWVHHTDVPSEAQEAAVERRGTWAGGADEEQDTADVAGPAAAALGDEEAVFKTALRELDSIRDAEVEKRLQDLERGREMLRQEKLQRKREKEEEAPVPEAHHPAEEPAQQQHPPSVAPRDESAPRHLGLDASFDLLSDVLDRSCPDDHEANSRLFESTRASLTATDEAHTVRYHAPGGPGFSPGISVRATSKLGDSTSLASGHGSPRFTTSLPRHTARGASPSGSLGDFFRQSPQRRTTRTGMLASPSGGAPSPFAQTFLSKSTRQRASDSYVPAHSRVLSADIGNFPSENLSMNLSQKEYTGILAARAAGDVTHLYANGEDGLQL